MKNYIPFLFLFICGCSSNTTQRMAELDGKILVPENIIWDTLYSDYNTKSGVDLLYKDLEVLCFKGDSVYLLRSLSEKSHGDSLLFAIENTMLFRGDVLSVKDSSIVIRLFNYKDASSHKVGNVIDTLVYIKNKGVTRDGVIYGANNMVYKESYIRINKLINGTFKSSQEPVDLPH